MCGRVRDPHKQSDRAREREREGERKEGLVREEVCERENNNILDNKTQMGKRLFVLLIFSFLDLRSKAQCVSEQSKPRHHYANAGTCVVSCFNGL